MKTSENQKSPREYKVYIHRLKTWVEVNRRAVLHLLPRYLGYPQTRPGTRSVYVSQVQDLDVRWRLPRL